LSAGRSPEKDLIDYSIHSTRFIYAGFIETRIFRQHFSFRNDTSSAEIAPFFGDVARALNSRARRLSKRKFEKRFRFKALHESMNGIRPCDKLQVSIRKCSSGASVPPSTFDHDCSVSINDVVARLAATANWQSVGGGALGRLRIQLQSISSIIISGGRWSAGTTNQPPPPALTAKDDDIINSRQQQQRRAITPITRFGASEAFRSLALIVSCHRTFGASQLASRSKSADYYTIQTATIYTLLI